ncbi:MAG: integrase, partial [Pseudomonadota bacterium]
MTKISTTCLDPYVGSFLDGLAASDYAAGSIKRFRQQARKLGQLMEAAGVTPSALMPALAEELVRAAMTEKDRNSGLLKTARRFAGHLIDLGVVLPPPPTEAQIARTALLADYEGYLAKQRGLSPRSVQRASDFAERFLDHRFGSERIDPGAIGAADVTRFLQALLS